MNRKERRTKEVNLLESLVQIMRQYFPELIGKFNELTDLRNQSYVKYQMKVIFMVRLLALMCEIKSMHGLTRELNTEEAIENIAKICGLELDEIPHCDTINDVFEKINVEEIKQIRKYMINRLIRGKMLEKYKIRNRYYHIIIDGTGLASSRKKYNKNCIKKSKTDKNGNEYIEYSTYVLEAKLVAGNMVFSIESEFVENEDENVSKQDCELNAFKRLAKKLKKEYPRLPIIIGADALYSNKSVIDICNQNGWKYIIRFKEGRIKSLYKEFEAIVKTDNESKKEGYEYVSKVDYQKEKLNIIRYKDKMKKTEFLYITNLNISDKNIEETITIGRRRWKIENEGFRNQKHGTFDIGHLYSKNSTAIKVHYMLIQIGHIIRQLLENGLKDVKEIKLKIKEISQIITKELISTITNLEVLKKVQLRFD